MICIWIERLFLAHMKVDSSAQHVGVYWGIYNRNVSFHKFSRYKYMWVRRNFDEFLPRDVWRCSIQTSFRTSHAYEMRYGRLYQTILWTRTALESIEGLCLSIRHRRWYMLLSSMPSSSIYTHSVCGDSTSYLMNNTIHVYALATHYCCRYFCVENTRWNITEASDEMKFQAPKPDSSPAK